MAATTPITLPIVEVNSADPRERGRQYGEQAREHIRRSVAYYQQSFAKRAGLSWTEVQERAPLWLPLIEDYLPGIVDEVRGIAEGSGFKFEEILALNGRGELHWGNPFVEDKGNGLDEGNDGCSSFAITRVASGDGHVYCGQNWDWAADIVPTVVFIRIVQPPKPTIVMQVEAGQIGRHGANSAGVALNANGLGGQFPRYKVGLPGPYIRRKVLDSPDMYDALNAIFQSKQAACTNLLLSHREGEVIDLETTPARHGWMYPTDGVLVHTNHYIAFVPEQIKEAYRPFAVDSLYRVTRIERVLRTAREKAKTPEAMRALIASALRDHFGAPNSVCCHPDEREEPIEQGCTIASSIVDLTSGEYYATLGNPCESEYQKLPWNLYQDGVYESAWRPAAHTNGAVRNAAQRAVAAVAAG